MVEDLDLPSPPPSLPLNQHLEYIQLKRKLALHEKKRRDLKTSGTTRKDDPPTSSTTTTDSTTTNRSEPPVAKTLPKAVVTSVKVKVAKKREREAKVAECSKRLATHLQKLGSSRAQEEREQQKITDLTNQQTQCVSEIAEHEQGMERVQQQLSALQKQLEVCQCMCGIRNSY